MKNILLENKFAFLFFSLLLALYLWGTITGFKVFRSEYGRSYKAGSNHGSIHHK